MQIKKKRHGYIFFILKYWVEKKMGKMGGGGGGEKFVGNVYSRENPGYLNHCLLCTGQR